MKYPGRILIVVVLPFVFSLTSCDMILGLFGSQEERVVGRILNDDQLDILDELGMTFNSGENPPDIEGYYRGTDLDAIGDTTEQFPQNLDYIFRFYGQTDNELLIDYENLYQTDSASGEGAYIFGENNQFSVYIEQEGTASGIDYTSAYVYSGTYTSSGIEDFQFAFILTEKDADPSGVLIGENEARVYEESDGLAETVSGFYSIQAPAADVQRNLMQR
ncbi:hypothetical protein [Salinispira pacifica]|uniref:Lipoprotein n=1 Tax=Salinispira pacifica TaxID=1307761 RepID=V5WL14_9SPIO|nr:hypothetical protein [Salinispira pacifica]AHC16340.1 hypothetical protein L21SP2_2994 [Salinispira pacifica]